METSVIHYIPDPGMSSEYKVVVTEHGKGMKMVLGIAAAFAIPFLAPVLAGAIGLSSAVGAGLTAIGVTSTAAAATLSSALAGAALGAGKAAIFNEDVGRGALFGGLSGGLAGYANAAKAAQAVKAASPGAGLGMGPGQATGDVLSQFGVPAGTTAATTGAQVAGTTAAGTTAAAAGTAAQAAPAVGSTLANATGKFVETLKAMPANILAKYSDPQALADLTLRAGSMLAGAATSVDPFSGLSPEEQQLMRARQEELKAMQSSDMARFNTQLSEAYKLLGRSEYFNPEYWGRAAAADAQMKTATATQAGLRNIPVNQAARASSEARRYALGGGREQASAYQSGFMGAAQKQIANQEAGLRGLQNLKYPTGATQDQIAIYEKDRERRRKEQEAATEMFGYFTGVGKPTQTIA